MFWVPGTFLARHSPDASSMHQVNRFCPSPLVSASHLHESNSLGPAWKQIVVLGPRSSFQHLFLKMRHPPNFLLRKVGRHRRFIVQWSRE